MKFGITGFNAFRAFRNKNTQTKLYFRGSNRVEEVVDARKHKGFRVN